MPPRFCSLTIAAVAALLLAPTAAPAAKITYDEHVRPIFRAKCFSCHNPDKRSGDLDLTNYTNLMQGGGSGEVIDPGDAESSYLYGLVTQTDEPTMPPDSPPIPAAMLETIRQWIDGGALENAGSKARAPSRPKVDLAAPSSPTERPKVAPMPARIPLEPAVHAPRATAVTALATSPWAPLAAVAGERQVLLYGTADLHLLGVLPFPEGVIHTLAFSRNGALLLAAGGRGGALGRVVAWNIRTGDRVFELGDELDSVLAADLRADHSQVALGGPPRIVRIYATRDGSLVREIRKHTDWVTAIAYSPDDVLLATADRAGGLYLWEAHTGRAYATLKGHTKAVTALSWRSDSNVLASASEDGTVRLWEVENGTQIKKINAHPAGATSVEFARDGHLVSCGRDRLAKWWDGNGKLVRAMPALADVALKVSFCDETERVITGDWTGAVRLFALDGKEIGRLDTNPPPLAQRLAAAQAELEKRTAAYQPLAQALAAAEKNQMAVQARLTELETAAQRLAKQQQTAEAGVQAAAARLRAAEAARKKAEEKQKVLAESVPQIAAAAEQAGQAAKALPEDKAFEQAAAAVTEAASVLQKRLTAQQQATKQAAGEVEEARGKLAEAQRQLADAQKQSAQAGRQVAEQQKQLAAAQKAAGAARSAAEAAEAQRALAEKQVQRWRDAVAFAAAIDALRQQREEAIKRLAAAKAAAEQKSREAKQAEAALADARNTLEGVNAEIAAARGIGGD